MTQPRFNRAQVILAIVLCFAAVVSTGCGLQSASGRVLKAEPGKIKHYDSLDGVELTVGSKDFTEQLILGNMFTTILATAGAEITNQSNTPGSIAVRKGTESGRVDISPEYTGTGWINYLGHPSSEAIPDPTEQYEAVRDEDLEQNDITWLPPAPLNNTYAMAIREDKQKELGITKLSELKDLPKEELTFCVESEFAKRSDGYVPMLEEYGLAPGDVETTNLDTGTIYSATAEGTCNFGEVFSTDGRIPGLGLVVLEDDQKFFPQYNMTEMIRGEVLEEHPELEEIFAQVNPLLTNEVMLELNAKVDADGEDPADVALEWLKDEGLVK